MQISVIIPSHNRLDTLPRAINSALQQDYPIHEIIVVDDASTDDTVALARSMAQTEPRIRVIALERSSGAPIARNRGAAEATGDTFAFLDSDDSWFETKISQQVRLLEAHPEAPAAFSGFQFHYPDRPSQDRQAPAVTTRADLYGRNVLGGTSSVLIRKTAFETVGGFLPDMPACQDWELWLRLAKLGPLVAVPAPLVNYYFDGGGRITKSRDRVEGGHNRILSILSGEIEDPKLLNEVKAKHKARLAEIYAKQYHDAGASLRSAAAAVTTHPSPEILVMALKSVANLVLYRLSPNKN